MYKKLCAICGTLKHSGKNSRNPDVIMIDIINITAEINKCFKIVEFAESKVSYNDSQSAVRDWLEPHWRRRRIIKVRMERKEMNKYKGREGARDKNYAL
jgi:hypothetical protein